MNYFGKTLTREEVMSYVNLTPVTETNELKISAGRLNFTVLPQRGLDICEASYNAMPFAFCSKTGTLLHEGGFAESFFGGLLTTCGPDNVGPECVYKGHKMVQHGAFSRTAAQQVCVKTSWQGNELVTTISGTMKFARLFDENLEITREITTIYGKDEICVKDTVENLSVEPYDLMLLYHINFGYPFLDESLKLKINASKTVPFNDYSPAEDYNRFTAPKRGVHEQVFVHSFNSEPEILLENKGIQIAVKYKNLPHLVQWKSITPGDYALGLEPAMAPPCGAVLAHEKGLIKVLQPFEKFETELKIEVKQC